MLAFPSLPAAALLTHGRPHTIARTASRAAISAQIQFGPPPEGFDWGYSTLDSVWVDAIVTDPVVAAPSPPAPAPVDAVVADPVTAAPAPPAPAPASSVWVKSWYDVGVRLSASHPDGRVLWSLMEKAKAEHDVFDPRSTTQTYEQKTAAVPAAALNDELSNGMSVPDACKFMADPTLEGMSLEDKSAFLASKGVDSFVIAQATCVTNEDNVQGHPELPVVAYVEGQMSVPNACKFMANPALDGVSVDVKAAYLASKGVNAFVIAQASCVAPEDNVQGHAELPVAEGASDGVSVPDACKFMADPTLEGMSVEDKSAFLASKGVDAFVIAQATCVTNEDNVQGHPELPVAEKAAAVDGAVGVPEACKFMADSTLEGMSVEDKSAFLASKGVDVFVIAQATCVTNEDNVQGHPELPVAAAVDGAVSVPAACKFMSDPTLEGMSVEDKSAFLASKGVDAFVIAQATCVTNEDNVQGHPELPVTEGASGGVSVPEACKFMKDPSLEGMSVEDKSAFLASKGVDTFVIAQATCVTNEDNVQGHPELPVLELA